MRRAIVLAALLGSVAVGVIAWVVVQSGGRSSHGDVTGGGFAPPAAHKQGGPPAPPAQVLLSSRAAPSGPQAPRALVPIRPLAANTEDLRASGVVPLTAPSQLTVESNGAWDLTVRWSNTSRDAQGVEVWRCSTACSEAANWARLAQLPPDADSYQDKALKPGSYLYSVVAYSGESYSPSAYGAEQPPAAPNRLRVAKAGDSARLEWRTNASNEIGYELWRCVERCAGIAAWKMLAVLAPRTASYIDRDGPSAQAMYLLLAFNSGGYSAGAYGWQARPLPPSGLRVERQDAALRLQWQAEAANADRYELWRCQSACPEKANWSLAASLPPNATSYTDRVPPDGSYIYTIWAVNATGYSEAATVAWPVDSAQR